MATNLTNSTPVNITNLPKAQLAANSDYFILQTNNGTQIISFSALNVIKTDINGNATVVGSLTGNSAQFTNTRFVSISSSQYCTSNGKLGITTPLNTSTRDYYDSFTIQNGLITSAVPTSVDYKQNPIYLSLFTQLTAVSAQANKNIFDYVLDPITISAYNSSKENTGSITGIPSQITTLKVTDYIITPGNGSALSQPLTCVPYIRSVTNPSNGASTVTLNAGHYAYKCNIWRTLS